MTAIESLPAYRKAEAEAERRGENLTHRRVPGRLRQGRLYE